MFKENKKQYISDLITKEEIDKWKSKDIILISSCTGSGKSFFILNTLVDYSRSFSNNILLLTNRNILKEQFKKENSQNENTDILTIMNYQQIEKLLLQGKNILYDYDFIVFDEAHYFFTDSGFSRTSDLILKQISNLDSKIIMLSATSRKIKKYFKSKIKYRYSIEEDYRYIDNLFFYEKNDVVNKLISQISDDEKVIYFAGTKKAYECSRIFPQAEFICSQYNGQYSQYINDEVRQSIIENEKFDCKILCTTTTMDNGINIKDSAVKHIIVDIFDLDELIQCLGRKRILNGNDKINVYIKSWTNRQLNTIYNGMTNELEPINYLKENGSVEFARQYFKNKLNRGIDIIQKGEENIDYSINIAIEHNLKCNIEFLQEINFKKKRYIEEVYKKLKYNKNNIQYLEEVFDEMTLEDKLNELVGIKMFKEQQEEFKSFLLNELLNAPKASHGSIGLKTINALFDENKINYIVNNKREKSGEYRDKTYWVISKL